jgi:hypothetical protein
MLERIYSPKRLQVAWKQVKKYARAVGIDRITVDGLEL